MLQVKDRYQICNGCGKTAFIVNKTKILCTNCNYKRLHNGKNSWQVSAEKPKKKLVKKATGELKVFEEIWQERQPYCINCGRWLGREMKTHFFAHIKPKSTYPELRLDKDNIMLLCMDCHFAYDHQGQEAYRKLRNV